MDHVEIRDNKCGIEAKHFKAVKHRATLGWTFAYFFCAMFLVLCFR